MGILRKFLFEKFPPFIGEFFHFLAKLVKFVNFPGECLKLEFLTKMLSKIWLAPDVA